LEKPVKEEFKLEMKDIYRTVYTESLKNAEQYAKDAEVLIKLKSYGHALAFCILGEEEIVKSMTFFLASHNIISKKDAIILQVMQGHIPQSSAPRARTVHLIKLLLSWAISRASSVTTVNQLKQFATRRIEFETQLRELITEGKGFPEAEEKQRLKLKGLYVDIKGGKVISPLGIKEQDSMQALSNLRKLIQDFKKYAEIIENQPIVRRILRLVFRMGFDFVRAL
jgi:AbiV family abortive infection protein